MAKVEIYSSKLCGFCYAAKSLLKGKGVDYKEIDVTFRPGRRGEMMRRANGRHSVPQIFIDDVHVGGCDDLVALDRAGRLDSMLSAAETA